MTTARARRTVAVTAAALTMSVTAACTSDDGFHIDRGVPTSSSSTSAPSPSPSSSVAPSAGASPTGQRVQADASCPSGPSSKTPAGQGANQVVDDTHYPQKGHEEVDVRHTSGDLRWDGKTLGGRTTTRLVAAKDTSSISLDLSAALAVGAATLDGKPVKPTRRGDVVVVPTPALKAGSAHTLVLTYRGAPKPVTAPSRRDDSKEGLGWVMQHGQEVTTYAEPYGAHTWLPVNETPSDKALYDLTIRTRGKQVGVFNGSLCSTSVSNGERTMTWRTAEPMAAYLLTLSIGEYSRTDVPLGDGRSAAVWTRPRDKAELGVLQRQLPIAYKALTAKLGPYPFSALGAVVTAGSTAMETQTMMSFSDGSLMPGQGEGDVVVHELAHQWFGDLVTPTTWKDLWLNEGWATYLQAQHSTMPEDFVLNECSSSVAAEGQAGNPHKDAFAGSAPYMCGALALAELREQAGAPAFWKAAKAWLGSARYGTSDRAAFERLWQRETGKDPRPVLRKWLDQVSSSTTTTAPLAESAG